MSIFTPDLFIILPFVALLFTVVSFVMLKLARYYRWARPSGQARCVWGVGIVLALALLHAHLAQPSGTEAVIATAAVGIAGYAPVLIIRVVSGDGPKEKWGGVGHRRLTNQAIALWENARSWRALQRDALRQAYEAGVEADAYEVKLRYIQAENDLEKQSVQALRRIEAERMGKEAKDVL